MNVLVLKLTKDIEDLTTDMESMDRDRQKQINLLKYELLQMTNKYEKLKEKLEIKSKQLSHYLPRNVGKRLCHQDRLIPQRTNQQVS